MGLEQEFNSLDAQREACEAYVRRQPNWTLGQTHYSDGGFTGANLERPAFRQLMADVEAGRVDVVLVYKVDRLSRSLLDFAKVMDQLNQAGAAFVSVTQNFSTADAMGRLTLNMLMSFAEFEREMIAERTRDKIAAARRKGHWTGGPVPFGYRVEHKKLVVDEVEAPIVRQAFDLLLEHGQRAAVAKTLDREGKHPRGQRTKPGKPARWTTESIGRMLDNPLYAGRIASGDEFFPAQHEALVEAETFERAQQLLRLCEREVSSPTRNHQYVLRGLLRCGRCGQAMTPGSTRRGRKTYRYYRCTTRDHGGVEACAAAALPAVGIERYVVERLSECAFDSELANDVKASLRERLAKRREHLSATASKLSLRVARLSRATEELLGELPRLKGKAHELAAATLEKDAEQLRSAEQALGEAQAELARLADTETELDALVATLGDFSALWEMMSVSNRGRLMRALVEKVIVDESKAEAEVHLFDLSADVYSGAAT
jgi:DNA invertase Pin-like site-specific DNA recombinase